MQQTMKVEQLVEQLADRKKHIARYLKSLKTERVRVIEAVE